MFHLGSDTRSYPVYIAIQDYQPDATDVESIPLEQGQIVEVLDKKNPASWLVRTKARPPLSGWIPGSYFETPTEYYKQRRRTRELDTTNAAMTEDQEALLKRDVMLKGLNYYSDDPGKVGQTFTRLERDFDHHVQFLKDLPATLELLEKQPFKDFFQVS
ncbi:unnamed protein product [Angiostrongylus costaricensis]|uniref:SH3 domain-containing protein n=1 Tax=Angiostrongylus costaricensis TaxID=334426 RepID=A0A158PIX5_ANGCS|nr:unnamed protein product [Angiostrongylus costaricensis]